MIMNDADDACRQISYKARLGGLWIGQIRAKMGKRGDKKKFLEKFLYGIQPFCKLFKKFA